jgi:hypothetical protein
LLAVVIGVFQRRTGQQKVVLDLFDRRLAKYNAIRGVVGKVISSGAATNETIVEFLKASDGVEFLFGDEVAKHLNEIYTAIADLTVYGPECKELGPGPELTKMVGLERASLEMVTSFYTKFPKALKPYMGMQHKAPSWPW